jgi:hypothetical protein
MLSAIARDQRGWNASALLGLVALVTSLLVVLGFVQRLGSRAPVLRIVVASLAVAGVLGLAGLIATDLVKGQMAEQPDRASMVLLASHYGSPSGVHWFYRMLIAYTLGFIVLGVRFHAVASLGNGNRLRMASGCSRPSPSTRFREAMVGSDSPHLQRA